MLVGDNMSSRDISHETLVHYSFVGRPFCWLGLIYINGIGNNTIQYNTKFEMHHTLMFVTSNFEANQQQ